MADTLTASEQAQPYVTDTAEGELWTMMLGDSCERLAEIADDSVDLIVYSPPFDSLFTYSPSDRDLGNSATRQEFLEHYEFIDRELLRVLKPGRLCVVHCQQVATTKATHGVIGLTDFRGDLIRQHQGDGWIFHGECTVDKDPQAQAIRTKAHALMFATLERDSANNRPALPDYLLVFRKPGDNAVAVKPEVTRDEWIQWARPIWQTDGDMADSMDAGPLHSAWYDIRETNTLNTATARDERDERHIAPLQLDLIARCVRLWSNRGEHVLSPFGGIGSEGYVSVKHGRRYTGCELKPSYWQTAVNNLTRAELESNTPTLLDDVS